ncbi:MAG TPA: molybdopterin oxidoreductase [Acidiferrobacteraceae bacterium]|nr:molybdopterin oxidoreductase [Acidiferrobacteraceae bacterium]
MKAVHYSVIQGKSFGYILLLGIFGAITAFGFGAALYMEHNGHIVTGMNNQIVWGLPHVFAVFLIVAASGALNVASMASVFGRALYKPLARLSGLLAIALLAGGLAVLLLDLGRPDRLIIAMTYYNFKSIFALNIILYSGFFLLVGIYLWMMFERRMNPFTKVAGFFAFIWRLILTTGTGSIFGFLVARQAYDAAIMAPLFIIMSFAFGLAIFLLVLISSYAWTHREIGDAVVERLRKLLGIFVASVLYFVLVYHLTNLYVTEHHGIERFILLDGGIYTEIFWMGQILIGGLIPLLLCLTPLGRSRPMVLLAAVLVILGGLAQVYVIIIGGQAFPLELFPGKGVSSSFFDGQITFYQPSIPEMFLGFSGIGITLLITTFAIKVLPFLPNSLANKDVDPHFTDQSKGDSGPSAEAATA